MFLLVNRKLIQSLSCIVFLGACRSVPPGVRAPTEIWAIWGPSAAAEVSGARVVDGIAAAVDTWITLDSVSFRPTLVSGARSYPEAATARRLSVVTSFQGNRYHPDVVRGLTESRDAVETTAGRIASLLSGSTAEGAILDFQEMTAADIQILMDVTRAIADSARRRSRPTIAVMIPAADSTGYPARILGRVADVMLVKLFPEHGVTTPAGPIVSPPWFTRRLGARAGEVGVTRIVAGIPADGMIWERGGGARAISYLEAVRIAREASSALVRDPASGNLHAISTRDGWEIWVADHVLIETLIAEGRKNGATRFALFGLEGADPELWRVLSQLRPPGR